MTARWIVTPYFFETRDAALTAAVPPWAAVTLNEPGRIEGRTAAELSRLHRPIADFVAEAVSAGALPVSVAGDCCASLPVMAGLQRSGRRPRLVWLDAHGDFNTPETSPSGFLGGMPLAMMVGRGEQAIPEACGLSPVAEEDVWLVGARDLDPLEAEALDGARVRRIRLDEFAGLAVDGPVHLHIDNDVIDAAEAPANNYPVHGGPSLAEVIGACVRFAARNRLCALSFSGWNGRLDHDGATARACAALLAAVVDGADD